MVRNRVFVGELYGTIMLGQSQKDRIKAAEIEASKYFPNCPICEKGKIQFHIVINGKNTASCLDCGCMWQICFGLVWGRLKWAKLETEAYDGKGKKLLEKLIDAPKWFEMAVEKKLRINTKSKS